MKVLFVSSGNSVGGISPIVKSQGDSLIQEQVNVKYYTIKGKGLKNYLKSIKKLEKVFKKRKIFYNSCPLRIISLSGVFC